MTANTRANYYVKQSGFLANVLREAKYTMEDIKLRKKKDSLPPRKVNMDRNAMNELRRYQRPPLGVHPVMQGVLLLVGEDEESTKVTTRYMPCSSV